MVHRRHLACCFEVAVVSVKTSKSVTCPAGTAVPLGGRRLQTSMPRPGVIGESLLRDSMPVHPSQALVAPRDYRVTLLAVTDLLAR